MKRWWASADLAAAELEGFPVTKRGVNSWIRNSGFEHRYPTKIRRRRGRGGGLEIHQSLLPEAVRTQLAARDLKIAAPAKDAETAAAGMDTAPTPTSSTTPEASPAGALRPYKAGPDA